MSVLSSLRIAGSALTAQRLRMDVTASNIANAESTSTPRGGPYKRERVLFAPIQAAANGQLAYLADGSSPSAAGEGVQVRGIVQDQAPPRQVYDPTHPDANQDGFVAYPAIDMVSEMTDMLSASRAYEANITMIGVAKSMAQRAIDLGRV
jgi:flagellar basal-body rod protein FlgC